MKHIVILGAGGHGREVAEILFHQARVTGDINVLGFVDDDPGLGGRCLAGLPILGDWSWFQGVDRTEIGVLCAVGQPRVCKRLAERAETLGLTFVSAISPLAHISAHARMGRGVTTFPNVVVNTDADLGDHAIMNLAATASHDVQIGRYCNINPGTHLAGRVTIGEGSYVGMGTNVIQGVSVGSWSTIGAGSVVLRDLPSGATAVGIPAQVIKQNEEEE
jgi:UDP-perosamine 4-acetyltransferase